VFPRKLETPRAVIGVFTEAATALAKKHRHGEVPFSLLDFMWASFWPFPQSALN
jgi:hypothetical protein